MSGTARSINCHTLLGEGAYYAPDLTKIAQHRGEAYLRQFLQDPSRYYSEERHGRLMPNPRLSEEQITQVIAFLTWISRIDNQNWPPRPILVTAASPQGIVLGTPVPPAASADPVALGEALFRRSPPACFSCHSLQENIVLVGPSLAGLATRSATIVQSPDYKGSARTPQDYMRESIVDPHAYIVSGQTFAAGGRSVMPPFDTTLKPEEIDQLVAYTWPSVNKWTHGTLITPMHGHSAFFGAYVMIVLAVISYAMPSLMGHPESQRESKIGLWAFWLQVGGMFGMTLAFAAAGIGQVYLERILGFGYLETQAKIQVHFLMLVATGILFTAGVVLFLWDFFFLASRQRVDSDAATQAAPTPA